MKQGHVFDPVGDKGRTSNQNILIRALAGNAGSGDWTRWKAEEATTLVALADKADRMRLLELTLEGDLIAVFHLAMPVPRMPAKGKLRIGDGGLLHLRYEENWRLESPPGWGPLACLAPLDAFMPNQSPIMRSICLGELPAGVPIREIVLLGFYAMTLQNIMLDETDPHGVLNPPACEYYRQHAEYLPLTSDGFFDPVSR
jgi:hypothetical protein